MYRPLLVRSRKDGSLYLETSLADRADVMGIQHVILHGTHAAPAADAFQPGDGSLGRILSGIEQDQAVRYLPRLLHRALVGIERNPAIAQDLLRQRIGFHHRAVQHRDDAMLLAGQQMFLQGGNGRAQGRVGRLQHILLPQFGKRRLAHAHRFLDFGIIGGIAQSLVYLTSHSTAG